MLTPEQVENRNKWTAALRSGKYRQAQGRLRRNDEDGARFCCLGVACDLLYPDRWSGDGAFMHENAYAYIGNLPCSLSAQYGMLDTGEGPGLSTRNDGGDDFARIADLIDANTARLLSTPDGGPRA